MLMVYSELFFMLIFNLHLILKIYKYKLYVAEHSSLSTCYINRKGYNTWRKTIKNLLSTYSRYTSNPFDSGITIDTYSLFHTLAAALSLFFVKLKIELFKNLVLSTCHFKNTERNININDHIIKFLASRFVFIGCVEYLL